MKWINGCLIAMAILSCKRQEKNSVQLLRVYKLNNNSSDAGITFSSDTLQVYPPSFFITGTNKSNAALMIGAIVPSVTCRRIWVKKMIVLPGQRLVLYVQVKPKFNYGAITIIGNVKNGEKTVFLKYIGK